MRIPPITPVLAGQTPDVVLAVVRDAVDRARHANNFRTTMWLAIKALQWLNANAAGFLDAPRGEAMHRRAYGWIWDAVNASLTPTQAAALRKLPGMLAVGRAAPYDAALGRVLSQPLHAVDVPELTSRMKSVMAVYHNVVDRLPEGEERTAWRLIVVSHTYDLVTVNRGHMRHMHSVLRETVLRKWREFGAEWPFIMEAYPLESF